MFRLFKGHKFGLAWPVIAAICLPPMAAVAFNLHAQSTAASAQSSVSDSAVAKAAASRKAFSVDEKRLGEDKETEDSSDSTASPTLFVSPVVVSMVRGERATISACDNKGRDVSSKAEWSLSNSYVAKLVTGNGSPYIIAKMPGEVTLRARIDERESSCHVKVYDGTKLPPGVVAWKAAKIPGITPRQAVLGAPAARPSPSAAKKSKSM